MDFEIETVGCGQIRPKSINPTEIRPMNRPFWSNLKHNGYVIRKQDKGIKRQA